jgi:hypothetical protein
LRSLTAGPANISDQLIESRQIAWHDLRGTDGRRLGAFYRLLVSELGCFVSFGRMAASRQGVFGASRVGSLMALFRGGAVTLGGSFMVISGSCMCISWHGMDSSTPALQHEGAQ